MIIDRSMHQLDLKRREDYGLLLNVHYMALQILEPDWRESDQGDFSELLQSLGNDLQTLGLTPTKLFLHGRGTQNLGERLGIAYIVRGSRLNAKFLRARVASEFPVSYLKVLLSVTGIAFFARFHRNWRIAPRMSAPMTSFEVHKSRCKGSLHCLSTHYLP